MKDRVLVVEDNAAFASALNNLLKSEPLDIEFVTSGSLAIQKVRDPLNHYSVCMLDYNLPDMTGVDVARRIAKLKPSQELIFMTADDRVETYKDMIGLGYTKRFAIKDDPKNLVHVLKDAVESYNKLSRKFSGPSVTSSEIEKDLRSIGMAGRSKSLHEIYKLVKRLKEVKGSILILGNTGTGKELVAAAINNTPARYFPLNCATYNSSGENFATAQLFGHVKGAYTGADKDQTGVLERAHTGTVFLDEIHCMSPNAQRTLLRTLETRRVIKFGDTSSQGTLVDFRLISAGKPSIETLIEDDQFVKDLYYRIAEYVVRIPDLNERKEDIEPLVLHLIAQMNRENGTQLTILGEAIRELEKYSWPGNARDLRNAIKQISISIPDEEITRVDVERFLSKKMKLQGHEETASLEETLLKTEKQTITSALRQVTSIRKAALKLGIPKSTLCNKINKLNIDPARYLLNDSGS